MIKRVLIIVAVLVISYLAVASIWRYQGVDKNVPQNSIIAVFPATT